MQTFVIGAAPDGAPTVQWTVAHGKEETFLIANRSQAGAAEGTNGPPVSLLAVSIPVHYRITNLVMWSYINEDPVTLLTNVAQRAVMHFLAQADMQELMSRGREGAADRLQTEIQSALDARQMGAQVLFVGLEDIHPPLKVAKDYEQVVGAGQERQSKILDAQAQASATNGWARGRSAVITDAADAYRYTAFTNSAARAELFHNQMLAYAAAPGQGGVYETRAFLDAYVTGRSIALKYFLGKQRNSDIIIYNLVDQIRPDLLEGLKATTEKK